MKKEEKRFTRHICLQLLYASELSEDFTFSKSSPSAIETLNNFSEGSNPILDDVSKEQLQYIKQLFKVSVDYKKKVDNLIELQLDNWDISRLALIDKIILRMSISEMFYMEGIPPKVSMAEGIEIAKQFSTIDSSGFINGILDAIYNDNKNSISKVV